MPWNSEQAKEAQRKSAEVRRRRSQMSPAERVKEIAAADATTAIRDLVKAAKGEEPYDGLSAKERLDAWKTVLAYGVGRPTSSKVADQPQEPEEPAEEPSLV